jgi:hypothetical protein
MPDFLQQLSLPAGWEILGTAGAGVAAAFLAFFAARRFSSAAPVAGVEPTATPPPPPPPSPDPFEVGSQSEKRASARRKGSSVEVQLLPEGDTGPAATGWVFDRSLGGLGITAEQKVAPGTVLKVRPRNAPAAAPWVDVEVRSCKPEDGTWLLGCSFRKTPPYSVLLLFG